MIIIVALNFIINVFVSSIDAGVFFLHKIIKFGTFHITGQPRDY